MAAQNDWVMTRNHFHQNAFMQTQATQFTSGGMSVIQLANDPLGTAGQDMKRRIHSAFLY